VPVSLAEPDEQRDRLTITKRIAERNPVPERLAVTDDMCDTDTSRYAVTYRKPFTHTLTLTHGLCHGFRQRDSDTRHSVLQRLGLGCPPVVARTVSQLVTQLTGA
jgi:hypothetical protein